MKNPTTPVALSSTAFSVAKSTKGQKNPYATAALGKITAPSRVGNDPKGTRIVGYDLRVKKASR